MKSLLNCGLLLLAAALLSAQAASGADRIVLLESFTNASCPPCADANPITAQFVSDYGSVEPISVINVQYHAWWPGSTDPMYLAAQEDNVAAIGFYAIGAVPDLVTDGTNTPNPGNYSALVTAMEDRLEIPSPLTIDVTHSIGPDCVITVNATITAVAAVPTSGLVARMALVQADLHYDTPPGANGETDFYCTMRDMLPDFAGTPLTISNGQTVVLSQSRDLDPAWSKIYAVVWVQNLATKEVLQSGRSWPGADSYWLDYDLAFTGVQPVRLVDPYATAALTAQVENTGLYTDTFDIHMDTAGLPLGWSASACIDGSCYPPFQKDFTVTLAPQQTADVSIDVTAGGTGASGTVTVSVSGRGNPCVSYGEIDFKAIATGPALIVVDDDGGSPYEGYYTGTLDDLGHGYVYWDLNWGKLSADDLSSFAAAIWFTGRNYSDVVDDADRAALGEYLDGGGRLFMSGQLIGYSIYNYDPTDGPAWHQTYLGSEFVKYDAYLGVTGVPADPVGDGLAFDIVGGDGANNQTYPSTIDPYGSGIVCLRYTGNPLPEAAVRVDAGAFKTVYFAFSFEGISTQANRNLVMDRVLGWLDVGSVSAVGGDGDRVPFLAGAPTASPNPFNPSTTLKFDIGGDLPVDLNVAVYDLRGRRVATLYDGPARPGPQAVAWDGRGDAGETAASGVYLARIGIARAGGGQDRRILKITLTK